MGDMFASVGKFISPFPLSLMNSPLDPLGLFDTPQQVAIDPAPAPPTIPAPTGQAADELVMPVSDDESVKRARRRAIARRQSQGGRTSTILTSGSGMGLGG
jgi:hypothetical protein